jgi:hypothetical protein
VPVLNKVGRLLASPVVRAVLGQKESAFQVREVMDRGKISVAPLARETLGEETSALLGRC